MPEPLYPLTVPPMSCLPGTPQSLIDFCAQYLGVVFPTGYTQIVVSSATPAPADNGKIWLKVDGSGFPIGFFLFAGGAWVPINPVNVWQANDTGLVNAVVLTIPDYPHPALHTGLYYFQAAVTTTGATTLTVNGFAAAPVTVGGAALVAGAMLAGKWYLTSYTGTDFELMNPEPPVIIPSDAAQYCYLLPSGTAPPILTAGDTTIPVNTTVTAATFGTLAGNAVTLGPGTYFISAGIAVHDESGGASGKCQFAIRDGTNDLNWQDTLIGNIDEGSMISVTTVLRVTTSASVSIQMRLAPGTQLAYGVDNTSARSERPAHLAIIRLT